MLRYYLILFIFFDGLLAFRAGACRRNVDGVRLLAGGIGGVSVTGVVLLFELSLLRVAVLLFDTVVPTCCSLASCLFVVAVSYLPRYQAAGKAPPP